MLPVVEGSEVGKQYVRSSGRSGAYRTLRESLTSWARGLGRANTGERHDEGFWALKDVSFELHKGEVLGVLGPNGSGKSTLLKIISQITTPTKGEIRVAGTVGSLLEVGTGFHPELTGRENVYLNGAIIGMSRAEVRKKFDEIVAFSGVGAFIDTPVKRYSSGMQVRLAFAIAAHIEPDILILDEVLAVGDANFQSKCMSKLKEIGRSHGRAVILVSHSMAAVRAMCTKALLLNAGEVKAYGQVDDIIAAYQRESESRRTAGGRVDLREWNNRGGTAAGARITWAEIGPAERSPHPGVRLGDAARLTFACEFDATHVGKPITLVVALSTADGVPLAYMVDQDSDFEINEARREEIVSIVLRDIRFYPGLYYLSLFVGLRHADALDDVRDCVTLEVEPGGLTVRTLPRHSGVLFLTPEWTRA